MKESAKKLKDGYTRAVQKVSSHVNMKHRNLRLDVFRTARVYFFAGVILNDSFHHVFVHTL